MASAAAIVRPTIQWEEPACLQCGSPRRRTVLEAPDPQGDQLWFAIVRCDDCGLQFTSPRPDAASIGHFYPADYGPHRLRIHREGRAATPRRGRGCPERRALPVITGTRLLDVGCGSGEFLERMRHQGWNVTGIDASPAAAAVARSRIDAVVLAGTLPHPGLAERQFDAITLWQSLEHMPQPMETLQCVRRLLKPGGRVYVSTPNIASWPARSFGTAWIGLDLPRHLVHFTAESLETMMRGAGLRVVSRRQLRHAEWLRVSATREVRRSWRQWLRYKPLARVAAWACYLAGQSDCLFVVAEDAGSSA